jgi:hypothetical protein
VGVDSQCDNWIPHLLRKLEFTANLEIFRLEGAKFHRIGVSQGAGREAQGAWREAQGAK